MDTTQYIEWARTHQAALAPKFDKDGGKCPKKHRRWTHDNMTRVTHCTDCGGAFDGVQLTGPLPE